MIEVQGLQKFYGNFQALKGLDFTINKGEILGLLGPNGAGKTTTMRILTGFLKPSRGNIKVADLNVIEHSLKIKEMIGYLPEAAPLYGEMLVYDYLAYVAEMRGLRGSDKARRIAEMVVLCGLKEVIYRAVHELSKGYKQRVGLAHAMMGDPEILVLDEPTSGLDPNQIVEIRELIKEIGRKKTVIFSTHILSEAEATCDRVVIINQGTIVADGPTDSLLHEFGAGVVVDIVLQHPDVALVIAKLSIVAGVEKIENTTDTESGLLSGASVQLAVFSSTDEDIRPALYRVIREQGWDLIDFHLRSESLENIFAQLTQEEC
ncbi:MAG: ATP-binding cassette domain-containing protein [Deltaproteobacteria bacterium]|nr:ATP-binding cassette domain-containing protein [Candidatus Tharpella sp.]